MNANGIMANAGANGSASASVAGQTAGKTDSSNAFAGVLVQAMEGSGSGAIGTSGAPAGLLGLLGLLGAGQDQTSQALLDLLNGLSDQLAALDPNSQLPQNVQDQLAALLLMFQNVLMQSGTQPVQDAASGMSSDPAANVTLTSDSAPANPSQTLMHALRQTVQQLTQKLAQGETSIANLASLWTNPVQNAVNALQQLTASNGSGKADKNSAAGQVKTAERAAQTVTGIQTSEQPAVQIANPVQPEIRKTAAVIRNPVWQFQSSSGTQESAGAVNPADSVQPVEAVASNGPAPVWTLLKGDNARIAATFEAQPQLPAQVPVQQFAEQIGKYLVKQFILTQGNGAAEAKISLRPEHLGQVDIKIMVQNGVLTAHFVTESGAAKDLLENQISQLRTALQGQGLQVEKMEVVQQSSESASASFFHNHHNQHGSGNDGSSPKGRGSKGGYDDTAAFEAELDRTTFLREVGYGSSLNVTA